MIQPAGHIPTVSTYISIGWPYSGYLYLNHYFLAISCPYPLKLFIYDRNAKFVHYLIYYYLIIMWHYHLHF